MKFNDKLKFLREKKGYTQDEVASILNIARQSVSKWENGINEPDIETLKKLCTILDCSISELIDDDNEIVPSIEEEKEKIAKRIFYINIGIAIFQTLLFLGLIFLMNDKIVIHIGIDFSKTYRSKWYALYLLVLSIIPLILAFIMRRMGLKNIYYKKYKVMIQTLTLVLQLVTFLLMIVFFIISEGLTLTPLNFSSFISIFICSIIIPMGIFSHPKFNKHNPLFGLKTNFTLSNEEAWIKCNTFCAYVLTIACVISYIISLVFISIGNPYLKLYCPFTIILVIVGLIPVFIYHERLRKKLKKQ